MGSLDRDLPALVLLLGIELALLWRGQRRLFWAVAHVSGSRLAAYALALPGTVMHEGAHYLACLALGVPAGRRLGAGADRVRLFWPRRTPEGDVVLGGVPHARTDPVRQALIAISPLLLMPPVLALLTRLLLGPKGLSQLPDVLGRVPLWHALLWGYLALSCGQAAFPSPGDRVGLVGGLALAGLAAAGGWALIALGPAGSVAGVLGAVVGVLALPAAAAALTLAAMRLTARLRRTG
jgi:hypothetical protein